MENSTNTQIEDGENKFLNVKDQIDLILYDLDIEPLPGRVIGTLCQLRKYINSLEDELQFLSNDQKWVIQNAIIMEQQKKIDDLTARLMILEENILD